MKASNQIIHGMWIGNELSQLEVLTIKSFVHHGHIFYLWAYDNPIIEDMPGLIIKDATEIIPRDAVFSYKQKNKFGHGKGSFAGFSDIFRYRLLFLHGGWWVDMDVTCIKPLDFEEPYVFRAHHELSVVGNVMKSPKGAPLMKSAYEKALKEVDDTNTDWHKPIEILNDYISYYNLERYIQHDISYADDWRIISKFLKSKKIELNKDFYFIHWMNEEWRARNLSKNIIRIQSNLGELMQYYGVDSKKYNFAQKSINYFKTSEVYENLRVLNVVE